MSTGSTISVLTLSGEVKSVYCHFDGYLGYVGKILKTYYPTQAFVEALVNMGDISQLGAMIGKKQDFASTTYAKTKEGFRLETLFYHRDRGEDLSIRKIGALEVYLLGKTFQGYDYIFIGGMWFLAEKHNLTKLGV